MERDIVKLGIRIEQHSPSLLKARVQALQPVQGAVSLSISLDRTGIPFEEAHPRPVGRPKKGAPKNPCQVKKRQCYCGCLTLHDEDGKALMTQRFGALPEEDKKIVEEMSAVFERMMSQHDSLDVVLLCDGASEMMKLARQVAGEHEVSAELVDFYHVTTYVHDALKCAGKPSAWADELLHKLKHNKRGAWGIVTRMRTWAMDKRGEDLGRAITFFENHAEQMGYAQARAKGYPIGSGNVEATCKGVIAVRFKRSGARWKKKGAYPLVMARAWMTSDQNAWGAVLPEFLDSYVTPVAV